MNCYIRPLRCVLLLVLICVVGLRANAQDKDWKLQPLKYNNPDLVVDLGVGLWAWPMPMDYDGDGDTDLLVACPDKPSNGVYYFENTGATQARESIGSDQLRPTPVFKPGIRLGKATHNMQVSFVNGEPRILRPGGECVRDPKTKEFEFAKTKPIYPRSNIHPNKVRANMWRYLDFDGDDDHDLIIGAGDWTDYGWDHAYDASGRWQNGPLHGYVYLIENDGSDEAPKYSNEPRKLRAGGGVIDVYGWPSPNFADFDNDGDLDLICGEFLDGFTYFQNIGTRTEPAYAAGKRLKNVSGEPLTMHLQMITPTAYDFDGDEDLDLIVGDEDGRVALIENKGSDESGAPTFDAPLYLLQHAETLKFGALATPYAVDFDDDGDEDIVCGNTAGNICYFTNLGLADNGFPKWSAPALVEVTEAASGRSDPFRIMAGPSGSIQGPCEAKWGYTTLSVCDWDNDGDQDIIYNSILAQIGWLKNDNGKWYSQLLEYGSDESPADWYWWQTRGGAASLTQWRTTPIAMDFDGDGKNDLVMLDQDGFLTLRRNAGRPERIFVDENSKPLRLNSKSCGGSGRYKIALVDWDGDSRMDLLVNSENATWYRNVEDRGGKIVMQRLGNLAKRNVAGHTSSPSACDFDKDGKPDLLVGAENGRLYYIKHDDCVSYDVKVKPPARDNTSKFPGWVSDDFVFTKAKFPQCHASTICETSRGLVAAWFGGTKEKNKDVGIWVSYHDGVRWTSPKEVANGIQHDDLRYPCWNPVLYQPPGDAPLLLFFKVGPSPREWWGEVMVSYDRGRTFRDRRRLPEGIDGPVRCKPILLPDSETLLCGSSTEYDGWRVHFEMGKLSDGKLATNWKRIGPINDSKTFNAIQPTFLTHTDGRIQALCRSKEGVIVSTTSDDQGKSWSKLADANLPNPNSGIESLTLKDGRHLLLYNHLGSGITGWGRRGMLNLAISDDGVNWRSTTVLEEEPKSEFSYPAMIQSKDGLVHLSYTWKRQRIKHVVVDPNSLQVGKTLDKAKWPSD